MDHHAYLLLGEPQSAQVFLHTLLTSEGLVVLGNPDIHRIEQEVFAIADARALTERALSRAFGEKQIFIISAERFTPEAQNALLKTFEEPIERTHFFILSREEQLFLPTLLSRMRSVRVGGEAEVGSNAKKFFEAKIAKRMDMAKKFDASLPDFLDSLLLILKKENAPLERLKQVFTLRAFASDPAASARLMLEHLALTL